MKKRNRKKKGFTLIELIVVIAILGILAAVAIPRLTGFQNNARQRSHEANIATLKSAAEACVAEHGAPTADVTWTAATSGSGDYAASSYINTWPTTPWTGGAAYSVTIAASTGVVTVSGGTVPVTP